MIPPFEPSGYLPPGIHPATPDEIDARFGRESEIRRVQMDSIRWLIDLARHSGVRRIVLNGSFVTDIMEPNDVDCVLLSPAASPRVDSLEIALEQGLPFLDVYLVDQFEFDRFTSRDFAFDREYEGKGMIEVLL